MYALLNEDKTEIVKTFNSKPLVLEETNTYFSPETSDEQYAEFNIFPVVVTEPTRDQYHTYTLVTSVVNELPVGEYTVAEVTITVARSIKKQELECAWENAVQQGSFTSQTIEGFVVDCRRNQTDNDVQNIDGIIGLLQAGAITSPVEWRGKSAYQSLIGEQLAMLRVEMLGYGAQVYQKKFTANSAVDAATTLEEIITVTF